jgi:hypothetical protein
MTMKIETPTPQRISVPEGTVLQIYSRDAHGNRMLLSLPGPADISMVSLKSSKAVDCFISALSHRCTA